MRPSARSRIVAAVWEHLRHETDADLTFEQVASWAGVSRQTVHAHFSSRGELLVAVVDLAREELGVPALMEAVYQADSALDALDAFVDLHVAFSPQMMRAGVPIEFERLRQSELEKAFEARPAGRRQVLRHVIARLRAEGMLADGWTVDTATDLVAAMAAPSTTMDLLDLRDWSPDDLGVRFGTACERLLLRPEHWKDRT